jgi:glycosyltransferase involved in cell wall biosynthesis
MNNQNPLVSICLPVYNGENYLGEAIRSVLNQSFQDYEFLLLDNASTDATPEICRKAVATDRRVRHFRAPENRGIAWNNNRAVDLANGCYLMWISHDDALAEDYVSRCVEALDQDQDVVLSFTNSNVIDSMGKRIAQVSNRFDNSSQSSRFRSLLRKQTCCDAMYGLMRVEALKKTGLFGSFAGSDLVFLCEMALQGRFTLIPDFLFMRRHHAEATGFRYHSTRKITLIFDPRKAGKLFLPYFLRATGFLQALRRAHLPWHERVRCHGLVCLWLWAQKREVLDEIVELIGISAKRYLSEANVHRIKSLRTRLLVGGDKEPGISDGRCAADSGRSVIQPSDAQIAEADGQRSARSPELCKGGQT